MLRRLLRGEAGFTVVELGVSMILAAVVASITLGVVAAVGQSVEDQTSRTTTQQTVRTVIADLTRDLRQAIPVGSPTSVIELSASSITFTTRSYDSEAPEKVTIDRTNCATDGCDLRLRRYASASVEGDWQFDATPFRDELMVRGVDPEGTVFTGVQWSGSPAQRSEVTSCGTGARRCEFPIVGIIVRATADTSSPTERAFEIREEVRIRSA